VEEKSFCRAHCRACGRHFASTRAFDRHRRGRPSARRCSDPADSDRFNVREGECRVDGDAVTDVAVWWVA